MAKENGDNSTLTQIVIQLIRNKNPKDVQELVNLAKERIDLAESKIIEYIIRLQSQGKLTLKSLPTLPSQKLSIYLRTKEALWYWVTLILAATTTITTFAIPENAYPLVYIRNVLGTLLVVWLPGYSLIKALFPIEAPSAREKSSRSLDSIERFALSIGMSLALVPMIGLILYYTPWRLGLPQLVFSLLALTTVFATVGIVREHQSQLKTRVQ